MSTTFTDRSGASVEVPHDLHDLERFRAWVRTLGEDGPRAHLSRGEVWIDMSPQDYFTHLSPVTAINARLALLADDLDLGRYHADGGWVTHATVGLSTQPDGFLVLWDTFQRGDARWQLRTDGGPIELVGRGDMVLEVISDSSVHKDRVDLFRDYASSGFPEYWIVDARGPEVRHDLYRLVDGHYEAVAPDGEGYRSSTVWGRAFRIDRDADRLGQPRYRLSAR